MSSWGFVFLGLVRSSLSGLGWGGGGGMRTGGMNTIGHLNIKKKKKGAHLVIMVIVISDRRTNGCGENGSKVDEVGECVRGDLDRSTSQRDLWLLR